MTDILSVFLASHQKKLVFFDVGVNIGQTLLKLKMLQPDSIYVGFEPNPTCVHYLYQLTRVNSFGDVDIIPVALGEASQLAELNLYHDTDIDSTASIIKEFRDQKKIKKTTYVSVLKLPDNFNKVPDIIKIDVEGAELEVLKSLYFTIEKNRPLVIIEILPPRDIQDEFRVSRNKQVFDIFESLNYSVFIINKKGKGFGSLDPVKDEFHGDGHWADFMAFPVENKNNLQKIFNQN
ncbi:FkbM family methyltransferase [Fulvivirga ulvae]|uniref:FkbM family methyltransferase n=1 Tax=Fulvivirga ulvae TaxID=2904245 RepID=UPI001F00FD80|nr:FkbM family methyltransferase [Fulvivirga ulvae]UII33374.1 FkbM family methyltransferase [Fulvivirga ulvae]